MKAIEARRVDNPALADEIPTLRKTIEGLDARIKLAHDELSRLAIRSPLAGRVWPPRNVAAKAVDPRELRDWQGTPLDPANRSAYLPEGTQLCTIGPEGDFVVRAYVSQRDVEHVRIGQAAWIGLSGQVLELPRGTVERISATPSATLPREVALLNELPVEASSSSKEGPRPTEPVYEVTIRMESPGGVALRSAALVRIEPPWTPLWRWVLRQVRQALRFPTT
jgi:putative peptide zinc metalloprotease protein